MDEALVEVVALAFVAASVAEFARVVAFEMVSESLVVMFAVAAALAEWVALELDVVAAEAVVVVGIPGPLKLVVAILGQVAAVHPSEVAHEALHYVVIAAV